MSITLTLYCVLVDNDKEFLCNVFKVKVSSDADVDELKTEIFRRHRSFLREHGVDGPQLTLWMLLSPLPISYIPAEQDVFLQKIKAIEFPDTESDEALLGNGTVRLLDPNRTLSTYWYENPEKKHLHIIVQVPHGSKASRGVKRKILEDPFDRIIERWRSKRVKAELPTVAELARIADLPLPENEKIPIATERMEGLVSSIDMRDICTPDNVKLLFRAGSGVTPLDRIFFTVADAPPLVGSEKAFILFWDKNVREILELLIPNGRSNRNSSMHTATGSLRPDYVFLLNKLCPFRGEEKAPGNTDDPKQELASKFAWAYDPAPYVLGYYTTGPDFTLVAITPPPQGHHLPVVHDIASANLRLRRDRIKNICRLINLSGFCQILADLVRPADAEFEQLERDYCTVEIAGHNIIKSFTGPDKIDRLLRLRHMYPLLETKQVPHTDSLVRTFNTTVILSPRGIAEQPKTEKELLEALICVLEALEVLHKSPPVIHRDIRWPNVMRRLDDPQRWFIIDWDDAAVPPTKAQSHFDRTTHSPGVFTDGHGAEVDIWSVGELILKCKALDVSPELQNLGKWMQGSMAPSAQEALGKIKGYQSSRVQH